MKYEKIVFVLLGILFISAISAIGCFDAWPAEKRYVTNDTIKDVDRIIEVIPGENGNVTVVEEVRSDDGIFWGIILVVIAGISLVMVIIFMIIMQIESSKETEEMKSWPDWEKCVMVDNKELLHLMKVEQASLLLIKLHEMENLQDKDYENMANNDSEILKMDGDFYKLADVFKRRSDFSDKEYFVEQYKVGEGVWGIRMKRRDDRDFWGDGILYKKGVIK